MRIQSEDGQQFIQIEQQEVSLLYHPSISVRIEASAHGFSASMSQVWLSADDMHAFYAELVHLEQQRSGAASLTGMSPDEVTLALQTIDRAGHMNARLDLTKTTFPTHRYPQANQHISITFEIDVSLLPRWVRQFKQLIPTEKEKKD